MGKDQIEIETDGFLCTQKEDVCFMTISQNAMEILTRNDVRDQFMSTLEKIDNSENIRGLVLMNSRTYEGDIELRKLIDYFFKVFQTEIENRTVHRFKNSTIQLVDLFINYSKPVIVAMNGDIGQILFGFSLACDFRFATPNTIFHLPSVKLGLPTTGVLAYYLVQYIGRQKSTDLLLTATSLSAPEAKKFGLLNDVTTEEELINKCLEKLNEIKLYPGYGISSMKRVLQPDAGDVTRIIDKAFDEFILNLFMMKNNEE